MQLPKQIKDQRPRADLYQCNGNVTKPTQCLSGLKPWQAKQRFCTRCDPKSLKKPMNAPQQPAFLSIKADSERPPKLCTSHGLVEGTPLPHGCGLQLRTSNESRIGIRGASFRRLLGTPGSNEWGKARIHTSSNMCPPSTCT
jgi:hypothetical protein